MGQMSVLENVAIGAHRRENPGWWSACWPVPGAWTASRSSGCSPRRRARSNAWGLADHMYEPAGSLPLGKQRLLEVARALAADPCLLLLDEPAAGLRYLEKRALADLLRKLRGEGLSVLLVEHDMDFVMGLVDRVYVMDFGQKIAEGCRRRCSAMRACWRRISEASNDDACRRAGARGARPVRGLRQGRGAA
jgi:branched-chain amino acid transport system permease protein